MRVEQPSLLLVLPRWPAAGIHRTFGHRFPPMPLLVLAALARRRGWRTTIVDENSEPIPDGRFDLVGISAMTAVAPRAYDIADEQRRLGRAVVLGGAHPSLLPGEALRHADAVVVGEAEGVLDDVLDDAAAGRLRPLYHGTWLPMDDVPRAEEWIGDLARLPYRRYIPANTLQTTRGCRFNCDFCSVIRINGRRSRHRDVDDVVEDLRVLERGGQRLGPVRYVFLLDDDLAADLDWSVQLFQAMVRSPLNISWAAQASIGLAANPEALDLAARSGCRALFTGFESVSRESLVECNKKNRPVLYADVIDAVHRHGILVEGGFIFGFDADDEDVFDRTVEVVHRMGVDVAHFSILTPYPGTHTFARMAEDGRITSYDWSRYDLYNAVFEPANMSATVLEAGLDRAYRSFYNRRRRTARGLRATRYLPLHWNLATGLANRNYASTYGRMRRRGSGYEAPAEEIERLLATSGAPANEALQVAVRQVRP